MRFHFVRLILCSVLLAFLGGVGATPAIAQAQDSEAPSPYTSHHVVEGDTLFSTITDLGVRGQALLDEHDRGVHRARLFRGDDGAKVILFAMHQGVTFPEHAANREALLYVVKGSGTITLGDREVEAAPGTWIRLAPNLDHALTANTPFVFVVHAQPPKGKRGR
jgi:quercetin dioxygenase-like cupin family protein